MKKVLAILLTLAMALSLSITAFAADIVIPASGSELTDSNNSYEEDLTVNYTYTAPDTTAEKVFNVTVAFTLPTDMALTYTDTQNVYTWDHAKGKYVLDTENSTKAAGELTGEGAFTITVTNRSNVPVEFDVAYTANTAAVFASEVTYTTDYENVALATVADGHTIGETGISITDPTKATTANTTFDSANCTGKLSVTGINTGKTPGASGTDTLGTFTVTIGEFVAAGEEEESGEGATAYELLADSPLPDSTNKWQNTITPGLSNDLGFYADIDNSRFVFSLYRLSFNEVFVNKGNGSYVYEEIDEGDDYKDTSTYTLIIEDGKLVGFDFDYVSTYGDGYEVHAKYRPEV